MDTIAFLGMGLMGHRMAGRLLDAGWPLTVWNRDAAKCTPLAARGARVAATPADAAREARWVLLCLADTAAVEAVVFGPDGVAAGIGAGACLVDFSSIAPQATCDMAARLAQACHAGWIDVPVSGGTAGAEAGTLVMMAGGDAALIDAARPVLAALASRVTRMGPVGTGQTTKLCNQLIVAANSLLVAEAVALARASGVDASLLVPALADGFADSRPFRILAPRMAASEFEPVQWKVATLLKDLDNVLAAAVQAGLELPCAGLAAERLRQQADRAGLAQADLSTIIRLYQQE